MTTKKLRVVVTRKLPADIEDRLADLFDLIPNAPNLPMTAETLLAAANACDVLCPSLGDRLSADFFANLNGRLKLIANFGAGYDHIDLAAAARAGVTVTHTPSVLAEDAADMCMALILAVPRRLVEGMRALQDNKFTGWTPTWMLGHRVRGRKLGIIGLGRVGQHVAYRARAFGLAVHYHNRTQINPHLADSLEATYWADLDDMLWNVDIVSINCPLTHQTRHLLDARRLSLLKPESYVVNISRGEIIDEAALADVIAKRAIAGAGLDVFEHEPDVNATLKNAPNVVLLPHMASATIESRVEMGERMLINIKMFADGHHPPDRIITDLTSF